MLLDRFNSFVLSSNVTKNQETALVTIPRSVACVKNKVLVNNTFLYPTDTDVFKTSSGRLKKVTTSYDQTRRRHDVWKKTSDLRRLEDVWFTSSWRRPIYDVLKTSDLRRLQYVWFSTSWRRLIYIVLKTSNLRRLGNVWFTTSSERLIYDVLKKSDLRCLEDIQFTTSWRRLIYDVLRTSIKRRLCSNVVEMIFSYFVLSGILRKF